MMDVSVTIPNWNRAELLARCLRAIFATPRTLSYEVIVVDNASSDDSVAMVRAQFPEVRLIVNEWNLGFGAAHNQAMAEARGRYLLLLNNDAAVLPDTIPTLVRLMDQRPLVGICSCPAYREDESPDPTGRAFLEFPSLSRELQRNLWELFRPLLGRERPGSRLVTSGDVETAWATGALLLLRREMVRAIGGFDERFFLFFEDADLCRRAWAAGWKVLFTCSTRYRHQQGASRELRNDSEAVFGQSGAKYFRKHHGVLAGEVFRVQHALLRRWLLPWRCRIGEAWRHCRTGAGRDESRSGTDGGVR